MLLHNGHGRHLPPKELHVLRVLLEAAGSLVSKQRLLDQVWPNCDVAEESLTRCIYVLRKLFGEHPYIKTVYGKGYCFAGEVMECVAEPDLCLAPSLLVLPLLPPGDGCAMDMQCQVVRQLAAAFGETLRVMPAVLTGNPQNAVDPLTLIERMAPDYYLSARCVKGEAGWSLSVELVRGSDHTLLHSQALSPVSDRNRALQQLTAVVAQRLPGVRSVVSSRCSSSFLPAPSCLIGLPGGQVRVSQGLGEMKAQLQLNAGYAPLWRVMASPQAARRQPPDWRRAQWSGARMAGLDDPTAGRWPV
ncbi:winged helix-turn-helix domain-containing protein [Pseudomonas chlororaphis subsp. aurantiaca]|uniref:winged helix-turn-helix domain-containing protein n=1 Tax=Pseudomonas chlororaphis TaxID=587753 RepID=UPI0027DAF63F|nr:winged helix-turn-helix domain-containing protein [Pseudomonas chlororaphis]WMI97547.1 winged helix-turn-helix domain-containing protein [Pseudomonas chlororaphis subsp. aurantiaca]